MGKDVIIACDIGGRDEVLSFLDRFGDERPFVKVGMELFYSAGPDIVRELKGRGHKVFLDLKLHDIPNTVERAMRALSSLGADIVNLHAAGTEKMMEAALCGVTRGDGTRPLVIAVTQLTSTSCEAMNSELGIAGSMEDIVLKYAENAKKAGLDGIVCSPLEAGFVHEKLGDGFITVTPGVRFADSEVGDQARIATPRLAREIGSDYIVVGRPITRADDPVSAWKRCKEDFIG